VSIRQPALRQSYLIHGIALTVEADEDSVIEAMDLRLRDFRSEPGADPDLRFEFLVDPGASGGASPEDGRPIYDTPFGSVHYAPGHDTLYGTLGGVTMRCEPGRGIARFHLNPDVGVDVYLATHPLSTICLMELLERRGLFSLHAACVTDAQGRGIVLAGPTGAGKSTLALALARAGAGFLSDDVVFLSPEPGIVRVLGFADAVGLSDHAAHAFADLEHRLSEPPLEGFPKRLARPRDVLDVPAVGSCRPELLLFPFVADDRWSECERLDPGEALLRLTPDVLLTDPNATQAHLGAIGALLDQVGCYTLSCGADLDLAVDLVRSLL
jgi:hypothetical protein